MGDSIETIISWRCLTTFLDNRGFGADGKALRLDDVQVVEVRACLNKPVRHYLKEDVQYSAQERKLGRGREILDLLSGVITPWSQDRCSSQFPEFACSRFSMVRCLIG